MIPKKAILLCQIVVLVSCLKSHAERVIFTDTITIKVRLSALKKASFNSVKGSLDFNNPLRHDTVVTKYLFSTETVHLRQLNLVYNTNTKSFDPFEKDLLLNPGDIIELQLDKNGNFEVVSYRDFRKYIDINNLFNLKYNSLLNIQPLILNKTNLNKVGFILDSINTEYLKADKKINNLYYSKEITSSYKSVLMNFNLLLKYHRIAQIFFYKTTSLEKLRLWFQSPFNNLFDHLNFLTEIKSQYNRGIILFLIKYQAAMKGELSDNFWDYFNQVDTSFFNTKLYKNFVFQVFCANSNIKNYSELQIILKKVRNAGIRESRFDSLLLAKKASEDVNTTKDEGLMITSAGDTTQYYNLITSLNGKYILVDFWATWCVPCRAQIPLLKKIENKVEFENVEFVSISLDKDDANNFWIASSKEEDLFKGKYNYRLLGGNANPLLKIFEIKFIPRYILYNKKGKIISARFDTPDEKDFVNKLRNAIKD